MHTSARLIHATPASREYTTVVRLNVSGEDATIDMGDNPAYYPPPQVTELAVSYRTSETFHGDTPTVTSEVTDITYRIANRDYDTASVHPDFLARPDEWPAWVRDLVRKYDRQRTRRRPPPRTGVGGLYIRVAHAQRSE